MAIGDRNTAEAKAEVTEEGAGLVVVFEDESLPGQLFDLEQDPLEEHNLIDAPEASPVVERLVEQRVRPFLATSPRRPHPALVRRLGG